jgi:hypothetical protein
MQQLPANCGEVKNGSKNILNGGDCGFYGHLSICYRLKVCQY